MFLRDPEFIPKILSVVNFVLNFDFYQILFDLTDLRRGPRTVFYGSSNEGRLITKNLNFSRVRILLPKDPRRSLIPFLIGKVHFFFFWDFFEEFQTVQAGNSLADYRQKWLLFNELIVHLGN